MVNRCVEFLPEKRVRDGFTRCGLRQQDFIIQNRILCALHKHWKNEDHQWIEIRYRLANRLPLLNKAWAPAGATERARQKALVVALHLVSMESMLAIKVEEVTAGETANQEAGTSREVVSKLAADKL